MNYFVNIIFDKSISSSQIEEAASTIANTDYALLNENDLEYETFQHNSLVGVSIPLGDHICESETEEFVNNIANKLFDQGHENFDIELSINESTVFIDEETYDGNEFYETYGDLWFNEDEIVDEAEYQGRKVKLGKPMRGDVKKFKVYVKNPKGNVVKVNFGDPDMKIKKSNPERRRSFRARHNCDNPGPRHRARYWSCRKW